MSRGEPMKDNNADAKERIMNTVIELLLEIKDPSKITTRQIAAKAGVNSALINYYYQSKENLMDAAVGLSMKSMADNMLEEAGPAVSPDERLRGMIKTVAALAFASYELSALAIASELKSGSLETSRIIVPALRELLGPSYNEMALRLMALQIVVPLQVMFLNAKKHQDYLGVDFYEEAVRNRLVDTVIDNVLLGKGEKG